MNDSSDPIAYFSSHIEHYTFYTLFTNFLGDSSPVENVQNQYGIINYMDVPFSGSIVHNVYNVNTNFRVDLDSWTLFFDVSKSKGASASCVLIDPKGTKIIISYRIRSSCPGTQRQSIWVVGVIECYADSEIIVKQVRNKIHCISPCLVSYRKIVRDMTNYFKHLTLNLSLGPKISMLI